MAGYQRERAVGEPTAEQTRFGWTIMSSGAEIDSQNMFLTQTSIGDYEELPYGRIHRIHKWRTRGKKLVPSHKSEALEGKKKLRMKTFSELAECLARISPKITLYGLLFKYNYVGCILLLMFSSDLLFAIKRDTYIFKETG